MAEGAEGEGAGVMPVSRRGLFGLALAAPVAAVVPVVANPDVGALLKAGVLSVDEMRAYAGLAPLKPYAVGRVFNVPAIQRPAEQVYQFSSKPLNAVYGGRDGGRPLASPKCDADYPTAEALRSAGDGRRVRRRVERLR